MACLIEISLGHDSPGAGLSLLSRGKKSSFSLASQFPFSIHYLAARVPGSNCLSGMHYLPKVHEAKAKDDSKGLKNQEDWQPFKSKFKGPEDTDLEALIQKHHKDLKSMQDQQDQLDCVLLWFFFLLIVLCGINFFII